MFDSAIFIFCALILTVSGYLVVSTLKRTKRVSYRRLYTQCVARLEIVAVLLNQMKNLAQHVNDSDAIERYEYT